MYWFSCPYQPAIIRIHCAAGKLPFEDAPQDDRQLADIHLALYNDVVVFDNATKLAFVISWVSRRVSAVAAAACCLWLRQLWRLLRRPLRRHLRQLPLLFHFPEMQSGGPAGCTRQVVAAAPPADCCVVAPPLACLQVHLGDYGSVEEAYLAGRRRLAATAAKLTSQNAPPLLNGKVRLVAVGCRGPLGGWWRLGSAVHWGVPASARHCCRAMHTYVVHSSTSCCSCCSPPCSPAGSALPFALPVRTGRPPELCAPSPTGCCCAAAGVSIAEPAATHRHLQYDQGGVPGCGELLIWFIRNMSGFVFVERALSRWAC